MSMIMFMFILMMMTMVTTCEYHQMSLLVFIEAMMVTTLTILMKTMTTNSWEGIVFVTILVISGVMGMITVIQMKTKKNSIKSCI